MLAAGLPDEAFKPIEGDDKKYAASLAKRNRADREQAEQGELFGASEINVANTSLGEALAAAVEAPGLALSDVHEQARRYRRYESSSELAQARELADSWCSAFVWPKRTGEPQPPTHRTLQQLAAGDTAPEEMRRLVRRLTTQYAFFHWHLEFPHLFRTSGPLETTDTGWTGGFACVIGNPPWERIKLQEQEFFAARDPEIATAPNAAARRKLIAALADDNPALHAAFLAARRQAEGESHLLRNSGRYPLTGRGDINTYAVFAETDRMLLSPNGRLGVILPTGIATDATTQYFFRDVVESSTLAALYDFENRRQLFEDVDSRFKFCLLTLTGRAAREAAADFAFFVHDPADLAKPDVRFSLKPDEITLLNPNTGTCPIFRSRRDAEITLGIYRRVPVLIREGDPNGNPWGLSFMTMFHMSNDSHLFHTREQLESDGWVLDGNAFIRGEDRMLPLYQGMMASFFDHRAADVVKSATAGKRQNQPRYLNRTDKRNPRRCALPMYWVAERDCPDDLPDWLLGFSDVTSPTNERTLVPYALPRAATGHKIPLVFSSNMAGRIPLLAVMSSFVLDYVARQKVGGTSMTYFYVKQLPIPGPEVIVSQPAWCHTSLLEWLRPRIEELCYTAWDMTGIAREAGDGLPPFEWDEARRHLIRAELDAAFFHLYGLDSVEVAHVMDSFPIARRKDEAEFGEFRTKRLVLEVYDAMSEAIASGSTYKSILAPPPGHGARHSAV